MLFLIYLSQPGRKLKKTTTLLMDFAVEAYF